MTNGKAIRYENQAESAAIQNYLFSQGWRWRAGNTTVQSYSRKGWNAINNSEADDKIFANMSDNHGQWSKDWDYFTLQEVTKLELVPIEAPIKETVFIDGKEYLKSEVLDAISFLKEVK